MNNPWITDEDPPCSDFYWVTVNRVVHESYYWASLPMKEDRWEISPVTAWKYKEKPPEPYDPKAEKSHRDKLEELTIKARSGDNEAAKQLIAELAQCQTNHNPTN